MAQAIETSSYVSIRTELTAGLAWVESMGARPSEGSRYLHYAAVLDDLVKTHQTASRNELEDRFDEFSDALYEATDFREYATELSKLDYSSEQRKVLRKRLQILLSGPNRRDQEDSEQPWTLLPRNTGLELTVAARFSKAGYPPDFQGGADVVIKHANAKIFLEAKRCRSERKIVARFNEAIRQCNSRISQSGSSIASGIAIVDFTVVANPSAVMTAFQTDEQAFAALRGMVANFSNEFVPQIPLDTLPRVLGLLVRYGGMVRTQSLMSYAQQWAFVINSHLARDLRETAQAIAERLVATINAGK